MRPRQLILRGLTYYWRTNVAVVAGVATAVTVCAGALLVGDSVRGSLRDLVLQRLGKTDLAVLSAGFFRERLADDIRADASFPTSFDAVAPLIMVPGLVTEQESGRRAGQVQVYGVDERFWRFHGVAGATGPTDRDAFVSPALAAQLALETGSTILVRIRRLSDTPLESLHGRKDDVGRTVRLTVREVTSAARLGEFSLDARQGDVRAVYVPLSRLQQEIEIGERVNVILVSTRPDGDAGSVADLERIVRSNVALEDVGLRLRALQPLGAMDLGAHAGLLDDLRVDAALAALAQSKMQGQTILTYLANSLRVGDREIPYSLVTAMHLPMSSPQVENQGPPPIVLTQWAATDLRAAVGDILSMEYYFWEEPGRLATRRADFHVAGVVPTETGDRDLAPVYPGISDSPTLGDWDPPFPIDLRRIRPIDEQYWQRYRTTPKAFLPLEVGQRLWRTRYGSATSLRITPPAGRPLPPSLDLYAERLREEIDPLAMGLNVRNVRADGLSASRGATDFGEYFVYFSFFLEVSALLLAALFFKLGVEQRASEVGLLRAIGLGPRFVRRLFLAEGVLLSMAGSIVGILGAIGYASLLMFGLRSWWVDAVGTTALTLHVAPLSLAGGALAGVAAAVICIWWTLRSLSRVTERSLLVGQISTSGALPASSGARTFWIAAAVSGLVGVALLGAAVAGQLGGSGAFFGAGAALLVAMLSLFAALFRLPSRTVLAGRGWQPVSRLGVRYATYRPGRSVLSIAVIASATFILIAVDAFRRGEVAATTDPRSGVGGYSLLVELLLPIVHDPNTPDGRETLNLFDLEGAAIEPFRLLPGDDASCLNLYEPRNPRILAPRDSFLAEGRFAFQDSRAITDQERANPWLLLNRGEPDGAIPVIADANSMTYVLHRRLGEDIVITRGTRQIRMRLVAALRDSIFQGELLMSQTNFLKLFPEQAGYQYLLVKTDIGREATVSQEIENAMSDFGADAMSTVERLSEFHRVENTYLSTFQTLGGLGLLLGTVGLATVLLRNVLERRRELALLGAVGYRRKHFLLMVAAENAVLLAGGVLAGAVCASFAIAPAIIDRGGRLPVTSGGVLLLFGLFTTGLLSSFVATRVVTRTPLLESLRSE
jgi:ABC-type antimicrobial peptide transport system permease subunit